MSANWLITIEHPVETRDQFGGVLITWETLTGVWAEKLTTKSDERFFTTSNVTVAVRSATWRIKYGTGVNEVMRLVDKYRRIWNIQGIAEVGRRQYHDLTCQSIGEVPTSP